MSAPPPRRHAGARTDAPGARPRRVHLSRAQVVVHLRDRLERDSYPRLQMALIVALTGGAGLMASFLLLRSGVDAMALRYPLALVLAYLVFLFLLWVWLRTRDGDTSADLPDLGANLPLPAGSPSPSVSATDVFASGGAGDFAGGGGGATFDAPAPGTFDPALSVEPSAGGGRLLPDGVSEGVASLGDADELAIPLLVVALAVGLALASVYVVWAAPVLFAELLADGALSYALYRRLRDEPRRHWLQVAFGRTVVPFAATALFLALVGWALAMAAPGARTLGEALDVVAARK